MCLFYIRTVFLVVCVFCVLCVVRLFSFSLPFSALDLASLALLPVDLPWPNVDSTQLSSTQLNSPSRGNNKEGENRSNTGNNNTQRTNKPTQTYLFVSLFSFRPLFCLSFFSFPLSLVWFVVVPLPRRLRSAKKSEPPSPNQAKRDNNNELNQKQNKQETKNAYT